MISYTLVEIILPVTCVIVLLNFMKKKAQNYLNSWNIYECIFWDLISHHLIFLFVLNWPYYVQPEKLK